jgi:hypothetical protein
LIWLGVGGFLLDNPGNQYSNLEAQINGINFNFDATLGSSSAGSVLHGLWIYDRIDVNVSNVNISRCWIYNPLYVFGPVSNTTISHCFVQRMGLTQSLNTVIHNNIIAYIDIDASCNASSVTNNVFYDFQGRAFNSVFQNNICKGANLFTFNNCVVTNNLFEAASFNNVNAVTTQNNQLGVNMNTVFVNNNFTRETDYQLKPGSPAIGTGYTGVDMGAFGGDSPYRPGLQPAIPAITNVVSPGSSTTNTIQVTFSAKSNN